MREIKHNDYGAIAALYMRLDPNWGSDLDLIKTSIDAVFDRRQRVRYGDFGCGQGFHLAMVKHLYPEICVTGVDPCPQMLEEARKLVRRMEVDDVVLVRATIGEFNVGIPFHVISFLNNGLGNICPEDRMGASREYRSEAVQKLRQLTDDNGYLVLSVYSSSDSTPMEYGPRLRLEGYGDDLSIVYRSSSETEVRYYSHRFAESEIKELLEENGFRIELFEKRMNRFVARARAT